VLSPTIVAASQACGGFHKPASLPPDAPPAYDELVAAMHGAVEANRRTYRLAATAQLLAGMDERGVPAKEIGDEVRRL
jgi:hypothetical protein